MFFAFFAAKQQDPTPPAFTFTIDTTKAGSANDTFVLPLVSDFTYDFNIRWGDGSSEDINTNTNVTHVYASPGTYTVQITGTLPTIYFNNTGDKLKIIDISQCGSIAFKTMIKSFYGCANLDISATDSFDLSECVSLESAFGGCPKLTAKLDFLGDTANVSTFRAMLLDCSLFNQTINDLDYSGCFSIYSMVYGCSSFNQEIDIVTPNLLETRAMMGLCAAYNKPITIDSTANVTDFNGMFFFASGLVTAGEGIDFSSAVDIGNLCYGCTSLTEFTLTPNMGDVQICTDAFVSCPSLTRINNLETLDVSAVADMTGFCANSTLDTDNYSAALEYWATLTLQEDVVCDMGGSKYNSAGETAKNYIIANYNWTFNDGGLEV